MPRNQNTAYRICSVAGKAALAAVVIFGIAVPSRAADKLPVVVELFTSQGCSSCPPANANLIELSGRRDVLPLSFAVTYWDSLGWKDVFDKPEYTARQVAYEKPLGQFGPYTPQMVINGASTVVGNDLTEINRAIDAAAPLNGPDISIQSGSVTIAAGSPTDADVWLVRYDPNLVEVAVLRGENTGRRLPHTHVVHDLERLGAWTGAAVAFPIPQPTDGLKTAILVQATQAGPILSTKTD